MKYLRHLYGSRLTIPSEEDEQQVFKEYVADFQERQKQNRLGPEENVAVDVNGRVSASGVGTVMAINGLLVKRIMEWRSENSAMETDRQRMVKEADLGFRQALALCPYSPELVWHYHALLKSQGRTDEARLIRQTAMKFAPLDQQLREWFERLKALKEE